MTDSSLTFLELSVSSSASFCEQSDEEVKSATGYVKVHKLVLVTVTHRHNNEDDTRP